MAVHAIERLPEAEALRITGSVAIPSLTVLVEELVDNSLDAGATAVSVHLSVTGERVSLSVEDNGLGFPVDRESVAIIAHLGHTSKHDGQHHGFRGQALASTVQVAEVLHIHTCQRGAEGLSATFSARQGLERVEVKPRGVGSTVTVSGLFAALPVRRATLIKGLTSEIASIRKSLCGYALFDCRLTIRFTTSIDGRNISRMALRGLKAHSLTTIASRFRALFGSALLEEVRITVPQGVNEVTVKGIISSSEGGRKSGCKQYIFLRGRSVAFPVLHRAILAAFRRVCADRQPDYVLTLGVASSGYDLASVTSRHEATVRLVLESEVVAGVKAKLFNILSGGDDIESPATSSLLTQSPHVSPLRRLPEVKAKPVVRAVTPLIVPAYSELPGFSSASQLVQEEPSSRSLERATEDSNGEYSNHLIEEPKDDVPAPKEVKTQKAEEFTLPVLPHLSLVAPKLTSCRVIGQFNKSFIVVSLGPSLFAIDQHAADEAYNFDRLVCSIGSDIQSLLKPVRLALEANEVEAVRRHLEAAKASQKRSAFDRLGFKLRLTGPDIELLTVPVVAGTTFDVDDALEVAHRLTESGSAATVFGDALLSLKAPRAPGVGIGIEPTRLRVKLASKACRTSIMIGKGLSVAECASVVANLCTSKGEHAIYPYCPHGRPTIRPIASISEVERTLNTITN